MKKLFGSVIISFVVMFFIWTLVAWITIPNFIDNASHYHLDLYAMMNRFNLGESANKNFISVFQSFINSLKIINNSEPIMSGIKNVFISNGFEFTQGWAIVLGLLNAALNTKSNIAVNKTVIISKICTKRTNK